MAELKPCPFCGKPVNIYYSSATNSYYVVHLDEQKSRCLIRMPLNINHNRLLLNLADAYSEWNRRADGDGV